MIQLGEGEYASQFGGQVEYSWLRVNIQVNWVGKYDTAG